MGARPCQALSPLSSASRLSADPVWEAVWDSCLGPFVAVLRHPWGPVSVHVGASLLHSLLGMLPWCLSIRPTLRLVDGLAWDSPRQVVPAELPSPP